MFPKSSAWEWRIDGDLSQLAVDHASQRTTADKITENVLSVPSASCSIPLTPYSIDVIFIAWRGRVQYTDEFEAWWHGLTEEEQVELDAKVHLLEQHGPVLPRPHSDVIVTSKHSNM